MALTAYQQMIVADGATNYWPLDDPSGAVARDLVGTAPGTISGGVTLNAPGVGGSAAMTFDGATGKIITVANVTTPVSVTFEAWINTGNAVALIPMISTRTPGFSGTDVYDGVSSGKPFTYTATNGVAGTTLVANSAWHHVVVVRTSAFMTVYVDGIADTVTPQSLAVSGIGTLAMAWDAANGDFWPGKLQDVAIYPRALSAAYIQSHYRERVPLVAPAPTGRGAIANLRGKVTATHALDVSTTVALADAARTGHLDGTTHSTDAILIPAPAADEQVIVTGLSASVLVAGPFAVTYRTGLTAVLGPIWLPSSGAAALVTGRTFDTGPIVRALPPGQGLTVTTTADAPQSFEATYEIVSAG